MVRFTEFEALGVTAAAMSGKTDGDCGRLAPDARDRDAFLAACGAAPGSLVLLKQVHGARVVVAGQEDRGRGAAGGDNYLAEADALITRETGLPLGITVADCVPVFLFAPDVPAVGLAHAGREGSYLDIAGASVRAMIQAWGADPGKMHALIGPSAGPDAYEVSQELADQWQDKGLPARARRLDMWSANQKQLEAAGLRPGNIATDGRCTLTTSVFHSYRKDQTTARNLALLML